MTGRVIILMMDSFGIGGAEDAAKFNDFGANTFAHIVEKKRGLNIPNMAYLGLSKAAEEASGTAVSLNGRPANLSIGHKYGHAAEISHGKDTTSGHWEMAGTPVLHDWGYFPPKYPSFPQVLIDNICKKGNIDGILGNIAASGTAILDELGEEHIKTGKPIFYTSADSVMQIAAHEKYFGLERLYDLCRIAFEETRRYNIARVIARPFIGEKSGHFERTGNRHDFSAAPEDATVLNKAQQAGHQVLAVGKINDIFAGSGISKAYKASGLAQLWDVTLDLAKSAPSGSLIFTNFVDFDMLYGHRRDTDGYAAALEYFDSRLPELLSWLHEEDIVFITADHGCDPTYRGTDHTREQVPVIMFGKNVVTENIGARETYADIAQSICRFWNLPPMRYGKSFL